MTASTTVDRLRQVIAETISLDVHEMHQRIGPIVVTTSDDPVYGDALKRIYPTYGVMAFYDNRDAQRDPATVFLADRIPAGIEEQVILREIMQLHGWDANPDDWNLLLSGAQRWDTWGGMEGKIHDAVSKRIENTGRHALPPGDRARVVFTLQEALSRGVEPEYDGRGVSGWLHALNETVRESMHELLGRDLAGYGAQDAVKLLQLGSPFGREISAMEAAQRALLERQEVVASRAKRMEELDAKFESKQAEPMAPVDTPVVGREPALMQRISDLTAQLKNAKKAIYSMAYRSDSGHWYMNGGDSDGDDVTSLVSGVHDVATMESALWDIKELVTGGDGEFVPSYQLGVIESRAYAGLSSATGTDQQRAALKTVLGLVQQAMDAELELEVSSVVAPVMQALPGLRENSMNEVVPTEGDPLSLGQLSVADLLGDRGLRLSSDGGAIALSGKEPATSEQAHALDRLNRSLDDAVYAALDAGCERIQHELGVTAGDLAGMHFCTGGEHERQVRSALAAYMIDEAQEQCRVARVARVEHGNAVEVDALRQFMARAHKALSEALPWVQRGSIESVKLRIQQLVDGGPGETREDAVKLLLGIQAAWTYVHTGPSEVATDSRAALQKTCREILRGGIPSSPEMTVDRAVDDAAGPGL